MKLVELIDHTRQNGKTVYENILNTRGNKIPLPRKLQNLAKEKLGIGNDKPVQGTGSGNGNVQVMQVANLYLNGVKVTKIAAT